MDIMMMFTNSIKSIMFMVGGLIRTIEYGEFG